MSAAQPIAIASSSKAPTGLAASPALHGSFSHYSLAMSPGLSFKATTLLGSSIDMEHGSLIKSLRGQDAGFLSEEMCRDYNCCGLVLKDLHALVDHFEEAHVVVVDPQPTVPDFSAGGFDLADDMDLDDPDMMAPTASTSALPAGAFTAQSVLVQRSGPAWNSAAAMPGFTPYPRMRDALRRYQDYSTDAADCVVPELLFSPSVTPSPSGSRDGSPDPIARRGSSSDSSGDDTPSTPTASAAFVVPRERVFMTRAAGMIQASDLPPPRPKPFRCPKPGCSKAYKQANGLKYHLTHGQCNFAPLDPNSDELKPYICQAGCGKRFKNMSGLRYHYLHSSHGQQGLELLDAGKHP